MSKKTLIIGKSSLAKNLQTNYPNNQIEIIGKPEFDFGTKESCDKILNLPAYDVYIITHSIFKSQDLYNMLMVNLTNTAYLINGLYNKINKGQIIFVSSAAVNWVSYPNIDLQRLIYNWTKECISKFCEHLNRKNIDNQNISLQVFEPSGFNSKMNILANTEIETITKELYSLIENPRISILRGLNKTV